MNEATFAPVVIIGGGFAGATLAKQLEKLLEKNVQIVVISRDNHLVFTPMLAEVAGRTVSPMHVVVAGRQLTRRTRWIAASVKKIDPERKEVQYQLTYGGSMTLVYRDLVVACGMEVNLSGVPGMEAWALPLKNMNDAFRLGNALVERFEQAAIEPDIEVQQRLLTTVVVGGGFSGVEIAGHLHDLSRAMCPYYHFADGVKPRSLVLQRGERLLPELQHDSLSDFTLRKMRANGVEVFLQTDVAEIGKHHVHLRSGKRLQYGLLVGTVGNTANAFIKVSGLPLERDRLVATETMQVLGHQNIWAIGDCAAIPNAFDGKLSPPTAQFALRQAKQLASNLTKAGRSQPLAPFRFRPQGLLASIGQRNGVAEVMGLQFSGWFAWLLWRAVYLMKMPTLSRKIGIAVDWLVDSLFGENLVRVGEQAAPAIRKEHHAAGDLIYKQGQVSRTLFLVEQGEASVYVDGTSGPVATLKQGEQFGLSAVESKETAHSTSVIANTPLDLLGIDRPELRELSKNSLSRELVRQLELRDIRLSLHSVLDGFPEVSNLRVSDVMTCESNFLHEGDNLDTTLQKLAHSVSLAVVDDAGVLLGVCSREGVSVALARGLKPGTSLSALMSPVGDTLAPEQPLVNAVGVYLRSQADMLPVVSSENKLVGSFDLIDALQHLLRDACKTGSPDSLSGTILSRDQVPPADLTESNSSILQPG